MALRGIVRLAPVALLSVILLTPAHVPWAQRSEGDPPPDDPADSPTGVLALGSPLACSPKNGCFVLNYADHGTSEAPQDYACGPLTYGGHRGTDFAIPNLDAMGRNYRVTAAATGVVTHVRDGMPDVHKDAIGDAVLDPVALGNTVIMDHGNGIRTIYGHLKRGSVRVRTGQKVTRGHVLGFVGLSGHTVFPHVHFEVHHQGTLVDPMEPPRKQHQPGAAPCGRSATVSFDDHVRRTFPYVPTRVLQWGFATIPLNRAGMLYGMAQQPTLPVNSPSLVFHTDIQGVLAGDTFRITIHDPSGKVLYNHRGKWDNPSAARLVRGRVHRPEPWAPGVYRGSFVLEREPTSPQGNTATPTPRKRVAAVNATVRLVP